MPQVISPDATVISDDEAREWFVKDRAERAARKAHKAARKLAREARALELIKARAQGPAARIRALGVGESALFTKYKRTGQLSGAVSNEQLATGRRYTSRVVKDLLDGTTSVGVSVERVS